MRREAGGRALSRSHRARRRRSLFVVVLLVMLAAVIVLLSRGGGRDAVVYDRAAAVRYADKWALSNNPAFWSSSDSDCANFVSQCVASGGLRPLDGPGGEWRAAGTSFPAIAWVNCGSQKRVWSRAGDSHTAYILQSTKQVPKGWRRGDVVYLGNVTDGKTEWQHVVICVGKENGRWVYDSHTTAHRHVRIDQFYPAHFSLIRYCRMADRIVYR